MKGEATVRDESLNKAFMEGASGSAEGTIWVVTVHRKGAKVFIGSGFSGPQEALDAAMLRVDPGKEGYDIHIKQMAEEPDAMITRGVEGFLEVEVVGVEPNA